MKIYVAGPFFNNQERISLRDMIDHIRDNFPEATLFIPMEHEISGGMEMPNCVWAKKVFDMDVQAIRDSDMIVAMYTGHYSDTGTVWEMGFAKALGKPIIGYIPAWAQTEDVSLMVMNCFDGYMTTEGKIVTFSKEILKHYNQK